VSVRWGRVVACFGRVMVTVWQTCVCGCMWAMDGWNTDTKEYVPPAPPVLPELPNDLFYPFTLSPASGAGNRLGGVVAGAHVLVAVAVACVLAIVGTSL